MAVAPWVVSDELWELVEPLLPVKVAISASRNSPNRRPPGCDS